eukprot:TRINITY_DN72747_c0_g1_i1.p1 TRINITY_DN72747_c0_g1~~TRINITY_DN72747_c0_g1_i1.p1  ORF type:complete len:1837 (+),score=303.59 TRINITY_DN72747_c0_g1_i1:299-5512(+)
MVRRKQTCSSFTSNQVKWRCYSAEWQREQACRESCFKIGYGYAGDDCSVGWPALKKSTFSGYICAVREAVGGWMALSTSSQCGSTNHAMPNPGVWFADSSRSTPSTLKFSQLRPGVLLLAESAGLCSLREFIRVDGKTYIHSSRFSLVENTINNPSSAGEQCAAVEKNPFNAAGCRLQVSCSSLGDGFVRLNKSSFERFYKFANTYVYSISGLRTSSSPCGTLSRWKKLDCSVDTCSETSLDSTNKDLIEREIASQDGWLRDVDIRCSAAAVPAGTVVKVGNDVFGHVHLHEHNVYDFSDWANAHPGGKQRITKWTAEGFELKYPPLHSMSERWEVGSTQNKLTYIGKLEDVISFRNLPPSLQNPEMATIFEGGVSLGFAACGSSGEIANDPSLGNQVSFYTRFKDFKDSYFDYVFDDASDDFAYFSRSRSVQGLQKTNVWTMIALHGEDQLRQRMAWALSQIFVVGIPGIGQEDQNERWVNYYDILVRNALGNFRDLIREVTYSPIMGEYLTYMQNSAFDFNNKWPDENYAREIMQLFTIGIFKLNPDGSKVLDNNGNFVPTYDNSHIMNFARVFTGLLRQRFRANFEVQKGNHNFIDPMQMSGARHDIYPKPDLNGNYLGDKYPLCSDLPRKSFLSAGARYEFIGFASSDKDALVLAKTSPLYKALCPEGGAKGGECSFELTAELPAALACHEKECEAYNLRVVKVATGYYEYVPPTCVHFAFYNGQMTARLSNIGRAQWRQCRRPTDAIAATVCCGGCKDTPNNYMTKNGWTCEDTFKKNPTVWTERCKSDAGFLKNKFCQQTCARNGASYEGDNCTLGDYQEKYVCAYERELVSFSAASARCKSEGLQVCGEQTQALSCGFDSSAIGWLPESCTDEVEVDEQGYVAMQNTAKTKQNKFFVSWKDGRFPTVKAGCPKECSEYGGSCICPRRVEARAVFNRVPAATDLRERLHIGAFRPTSQTCTSGCNGGADEVKVYSSKTDGAIDVDTVFEHDGAFFRNMESVVIVAGFEFRNPPMFLAYPGESSENRRAAAAEVESLLDHLVQHPNTPPFIVHKLIQRLVTSNPSPAYIRDVAEAFKAGSYAGIGKGRYGDLAATVAAILLHKEARGESAAEETTRGALREPVVKVMHLLRAMEYKEDVSGAPHITGDGSGRMVKLQDLSGDIGQWPYKSPSVFNFYRADYHPASFTGGLVAPEFEIFTTPFAMNFFNGIVSLLNAGLSSCKEGFGMPSATCTHGKLMLPDSGVAANESVAKIDTLLTGGRLSSRQTALATQAYEEAPSGEKLAAAAKVVTLSPAFHTHGDTQATGKDRSTKVEEDVGLSSAPYKAMVLLYLDGGADTFNMIVPLGCSLYDEYVKVRQDIALVPGQLQKISTAGQTCSNFGIHFKLPFVKQLYDEGNAAFVSNVGALVEPTTKEQFRKGGASRCVGLFSHSDQKTAAATLKCQVAGASPQGLGGRLADALASQYRTTSFSLNGKSVWSQGMRTQVEIVDKKRGAVRFTEYDQLKSIVDNITSEQYNQIYSEEYAKQLANSFASSEKLAKLLDASTLKAGEYPAEEALAMQFRQIARLISTRGARKAERDFFFLSIGGFDNHNEAFEALCERFEIIDAALRDFVKELKAQNVFESTVIFTESDFGRSLSSNGAGTDHAWAGNHLVIGGSVLGNKVYNQYPKSLVEGNEQDAGRGRMIPQYPWESMLVPIAQWMGMNEADRLSVFPNSANFNSSLIIERQSLFK